MKLKKVSAFLLATAMVVSLVGCQNSRGNPSGGASDPGSEGKTKQVSAAGEFPFTEEPTTLRVFCKQPSEITDLKTNLLTKEIEEKTNIIFDMIVVPTDGGQDKQNMLLATGDYPEILFGSFGNSELVKYGTGEGILMPLNDLIEKYGVNIKKRWKDAPQLEKMMTTPDGNIYGIPSLDSGGLAHGSYSMKMWMNVQWLDNLGLEIPQTTGDFKAALKAFKEQDANGNGDTNDEIPMTGAIGTWRGDVYPFLLNAFEYFEPDNGYIKSKDGVFSSVLDTDGIKEGLKYIEELYREGLIDPAGLTQDESQMRALSSREDPLIGAATAGHLGILLDINDKDRAAQYDNLLPLEGPAGYRGMPGAHAANVNGAAFVITDKCKNPEVAIKLADMFCDEQFILRTQLGIKGEHWDDADAGTFTADGKTPATYKYISAPTGVEKENFRWNWTCRLLETDWKSKFAVVGDINDPSNYEGRLARCTEKLIPYLADVDDIPPFFLKEADGTKLNSMKTATDDYVKNSFVDFITGAKSLDDDWGAYLAGLEKLQYKEFVALNQKAYDEAYK